MPHLGTLALCVIMSANPPLTQHHFQRRPGPAINVRYQLYLPDGYADSKEKFPIVVFLHGAGERGTDLERTSIHGPGREIKEGRQYPFIALIPQCDEEKWWDVRALSALLTDLEKHYRIDKEREYLTGLSMGGYGTWEWAGFEPQRFAAIAPVCGGGSRVWIRGMKSMPITCVHGDADPVVRIVESEMMVEAARETGCAIRFRVVRGGGHDVWTDFYDSDEWWKWMLQHRRSDRFNGSIKPSFVREER